MEIGNIRPVDIDTEMRRSYLDYAMSVIVQRALPDVRDGLKPVQRRILYAMSEMGLRANTRYRKSAGAVGEVLKTYHPHGEAAVYDALVRMVQDFSLRYPLVDGQGNFGSVDGDGAAAMRYTEARSRAIAEEMLADIDKNTVDFVPNYDDETRNQPSCPARLPEPAAQRRVRHRRRHGDEYPAAQSDRDVRRAHPSDRQPRCHCRGSDAVHHRPGLPDRRHDPRPRRHHCRPTRPAEAASSSAPRRTSRRRRGNRYAIIVTEIPYQVNKRACIEKIAELVKEADSTASATCATSRIAPACGSSSSSSAMRSRARCSTTSTSTPRCSRPSASTCWRWSMASSRAC